MGTRFPIYRMTPFRVPNNQRGLADSIEFLSGFDKFSLRDFSAIITVITTEMLRARLDELLRRGQCHIGLYSFPDCPPFEDAPDAKMMHVMEIGA